ncbi:RNA-binding domain-containing protein [Plenodomus tracheiphilus IPT5]|uniref:RNA-binding domain-containing protein n=1 Tax=Plenodomus tracheiphilus IPT5 TaxID=1408161 RepID=A0A6A7BJN3_9PLEO|nr:RNA-binding domain-containing protein [Plenodomus tracheiphilus IPT5]
MSAPSARHWEQNKEATVYCGNLHERVTPRILHELMLNAGRVRNVNMPVDRVNGQHQGFGFVEYHTEEEADYASHIMNNITMYGTRIRVNKASADKQRNVEIGAELFIGNLDAMVDEKTLYDTFGQFGPLVNAPKIARDEANLSKGYGFISFGDFESSDAAIASMHGQYMMNKQISVQYAYKKDGKGERHGDEAERMLAKQAKAHGVAPAVQPLPAHLFQLPPGANAPSGPGMGADNRGVAVAPSGPAGFGPPNGGQGYGAPSGPPGFGAPNGSYGRPLGGPPSGPPSLPPAGAGLPARPPSGAPTNFYPPPPGFNTAPPPGFNPAYGAPPGYGPPGFPPQR